MIVLLISKGFFCAKFTNTLALLNPSLHIPISNRLGNGEDRYISISPPNLTAEKLHLPFGITANRRTDGRTDLGSTTSAKMHSNPFSS